MPKKITIVHITSSLKMGGAEAVLCDLVSSLDTFDHTVIYFHDGPHKACLERLGIAHYYLPYGPLFFIRLINLLRTVRPDGIHTLLWAANVAGRIAGMLLTIPVVSAWHNNVDQDGLLRNMLDRVTSRMAQGHIAVSGGVLESAQRAALYTATAQVITNGVAVERIHLLSREHQVSRAQLGLSSDHFVIGSVGRFMPVKRYDLMIDAFALLYEQYPHARLVLVGGGELEVRLKKHAHSSGIAHAVVFVIGKVSYPYYPLFDCFTLSSDKEGISIALLEAMSFKIPGVVTHADVVHGVIEHTCNGLLVNAGDAQGLAHSWLRLVRDSEYRGMLGQAAYATVEKRFSSKRMSAEYQAAFTELIREK